MIYSKLQAGDIILVRAQTILGSAIAMGEEIEERLSAQDIIDAAGDRFIPDHSLFIRDQEKHIGAEMTWPHAGKVNLDGIPHVVAAFRCPYLRDEYCSDAANLREKLCAWMDTHATLDQIYGVLNLVAFLRIVPEDKKHCVCSMWTTLGLQKIIEDAGYDLSLPASWRTPERGVGLVSPIDQDHVFSNLVWNINPF